MFSLADKDTQRFRRRPIEFGHLYLTTILRIQRFPEQTSQPVAYTMNNQKESNRPVRRHQASNLAECFAFFLQERKRELTVTSLFVLRLHQVKVI